MPRQQSCCSLADLHANAANPSLPCTAATAEEPHPTDTTNKPWGLWGLPAPDTKCSPVPDVPLCTQQQMCPETELKFSLNALHCGLSETQDPRASSHWVIPQQTNTWGWSCCSLTAWTVHLHLQRQPGYSNT